MACGRRSSAACGSNTGCSEWGCVARTGLPAPRTPAQPAAPSIPCWCATLAANPQHWELVARIAAREALPFLGKEGNAVQEMEAFLDGQATWRQIRAEAENRAEELSVIPSAIALLAAAIRRRSPLPISPPPWAIRLDRHLQLYGRFATTELARAYGRANEGGANPSRVIVSVPTASLAQRDPSPSRHGLDAAPEVVAIEA